MKPVEEAFASETFRRIVLPGIVLTIGIHPLIARWASPGISLYGVDPAVLMVVEIIFLGMVASSAIQWIYYVYEGFRIQWLTKPAGRLNQRRVRKLTETRREIAALSSRSESQDMELNKAYEALLDFPVRRQADGSMEYFSERPTRLGNIVASYELYPESRYGVDGVFYWFHLLSLAPQETRKEFAEKYGFAESLILASFSGAIVAVLHAVTLAGFGIGRISHRLVFVVLGAGPKASAFLLVFGIVMWLLFYAAALPAHREAGKIFQCMVDTAMPSFAKWLTEVKVPIGEITA